MDRDPMPTVRVLPGEAVRFHLPFPPTAVVLTLAGRSTNLVADAASEWSATGRGGPATLDATSTMGRVTYRVWLAITQDRSPAKIRRRPGALRPGDPMVIETDQSIRLRGCVRSRPVSLGIRRDITLRPLLNGAHRIGVGVLPPGRYSVRLEARDVGGNLTRHATTFTVRPSEPAG